MSERRLCSFKVLPADLAAIDRLAKEYGMSRSRYMIDAALARLPETVVEAEERLLTIEERLDALERRQGLGL